MKNTVKYFIFVMKAPRGYYGGLSGKLKHFMKALKQRAIVRKNGRLK